MSFLNSLGRAVGQVLRREAERTLKPPSRGTTGSPSPTTGRSSGTSPEPGSSRRADSRRTGRQSTSTSPSGTTTPQPATDYPGDFTGTPVLTYQPREDQAADPGEVVWTWVPYEEDHSQGKDRPVLVIGRADGWLLALPLTSQDHDRDAQQEAREGRFWLDIGTGAWDREGRASEVRVNRILQIDPTRIRRLAGRLDRERFGQVAAEVMTYYGGRRDGR
ncbi:MAG: type II toxin-antitoxin system PemK/MazF family toxin [Propionicimonas sp.]|uniref:type II toxin-antitoxin system PemK/MazF family toxin n=1 Tax=Propionicimonas sp. TaxID=1955623 RepID=UPI002B20559E|nr:type II toxin-antitoxin system PemK/MazF family toxin [Propionicimonas sp.]MEA4944588.1 type II toxin-antitoxin system PemK/MazF family toxin [Propionicimonas sp.]MEA5052688.1 type II toxin-antitoxin system PemK/MazF family toxin [Propionicimonas sp.]